MGEDDLSTEFELIDLSGIDLAILADLRNSALAQSIRRVRQAAEDPDEAILSFQDSI